MLRSLRYACFGGDVLTKRDVSKLRALAPAVTCVNFYGATETPQAMGYFIIPNEEDEGPVSRSDAGRVSESVSLWAEALRMCNCWCSMTPGS